MDQNFGLGCQKNMGTFHLQGGLAAFGDLALFFQNYDFRNTTPATAMLMSTQTLLLGSLKLKKRPKEIDTLLDHSSK